MYTHVTHIAKSYTIWVVGFLKYFEMYWIIQNQIGKQGFHITEMETQWPKNSFPKDWCSNAEANGLVKQGLTIGG